MDANTNYSGASKSNIFSSSQFDELKEITKLKDCITNSKFPINITGLNTIHKSHFIFYLYQQTNKNCLIITSDESQAHKLCEDINSMANQNIAYVFGARDYTFRSVDSVSREYEYLRLNTLSAIQKGIAKIVIASVEGATQLTVPPEVLKQHSFILRSGESYKIEELSKKLVSCGYIRRDQVTGFAEFSIRGGLLDIFSPDSRLPIRVEFWGDEIDSINTFDVHTQRRLDWIDSVEIIPTMEVICSNPTELGEIVKDKIKKIRSKNTEDLKNNFSMDLEKFENSETPASLDKYIPIIYPTPTTIFDYFSNNDLLFMNEFVNIKESSKNQSIAFNEDIKAMFSDSILFKGLDFYYIEFQDILRYCEQINTICLDTFPRISDEFRYKSLININCVTLSTWGGEYSALKDDLQNYISQKYSVVVLAGTEKYAKKLSSDLLADNISAYFSENISQILAGQIYISSGSLSSGFEYPDAKFAVISHVKVHKSRKKKKSSSKSKDAIRNLSDLTIGDYVVHSGHGIGVFEGIHKIETQGLIKDYIKIKYLGADVLYVPVTQLDLVSKYIGSSDSGHIKLNKLNSGQWEKTRSRVRKAVQDMAKELIDLYSKRMNSKGFAFSSDNEWQREFEEKFEYQETDDQLNAISDIKKDMEDQRPMDRLLCGDVGFGKTEVALRAAFKCVMDGKQCAILVPTTILAWQHYKTLLKRFDGYPINIELMSRFRTQKQQEETVKKLRRGEVDIVVGTHRIVQKDIKFKDLGLAIIDEEQRFGVRHKEQLKETTTNVDVLTLSATPIPRTLNMAMSGIRDMSVIEEAPQDRQPIQTYVMEYNHGVILEALKRELRRNGQIYYLHNRVDSITHVATRLSEQLPDANIGIAHGRMGEEELSEVWRKLINHEIDILVCTTIIETGIDVANCNTLIIEDADKMGLSQLYQLRGRIGRSNKRAFAYFTFSTGKVVTDVAAKRLAAIREFTNFGSGFQIAMRDLEIRGAGNILSASQHGHMESVGYDMYIKLLSDAIAIEKGEKPSSVAVECLVDVRIDAYIPENYIFNLTQRLDIYRRIAEVQTKEDSIDVIDELIDRFGEPPRPVKGLIEVALLRNTAANLGISEITQNGDALLFYQEKFSMETVSYLVSKFKGRVTVNAGKKPYISVRIPKNSLPIKVLRETLETMSEIIKV